jgi:outer membrane protein OmpA-like peptidoglycan-associated protein
MKSVPILIAAAVTLACASFAADAQERGYRRDGGGSTEKHFRDGRRDWNGGHRYSRPHHHYHYSPYRSWRYYDPYWYWPAPVFAYPYPIYEPAPVIIDHGYIPARPYYEERVESPVPYPERSYAQAEPSKPQPRTELVRPPRLERYTLSAKELFEFDKATLRKPQPKLDEIAEAMKKNPQIDNVTITGYTDRLGTEAYNLELSMRRANAVKSYLIEKGVEARRLRAQGKGEANPVVDCKETNRAELIKCLEPNRRVEVEQITVERRVP